MEFLRFDPDQAAPLAGSTHVTYMPLQRDGRIVAMLLNFGRKGDTGKREVAADVLVVVISGTGRLRSGGQIADLKAGDVALLPGGILHHLWTSDSEMTLVMMERTG